MTILDVIVCTVLQIFDVADFPDTIVLMLATCFINIICMIGCMVVDFFRKNIERYYLIAIGVFGGFLCGIAQVWLYFQRTKPFHGVFVACGLMFLMIVAIISTVQEVLVMENEKRKAVLSSESKARFLANMSHEIRTPINAVLGIDEMILRETDEELIREYAGDIQSAGRSLLSLVNDILDFSKIESGKMEIIPVEYAVSSLISDCYHMISMRAEKKGLAFLVENDSTVPCVLFGDEVRLRQIIVNFLTNAVKYTDQGNVVLSVGGEKREDGKYWLRVAVKDTGKGITIENQQKLFDSFQRVDEENNRNIEGTGLGLNITKQLVELMGGKIYVESTYGVGSVFSAEIPQEVRNETPMGECSERYLKELGRNEDYGVAFEAPGASVLVVDDVEMNRKVFVGLLKDTGIQIDTAESGKQCLEMIRDKAYHMIFLDHMMPEMDGVETLYHMRSGKNTLNKDTPVIMLTANAIMGAKEEYLAQGFADYLSKPVRRKDLEKMIKKYLPETMIQQNDSTAKEEPKDSFLDRLNFLDVETGMKYCGESIEIYKGTMKVYMEKNHRDKLEEYFEKKDWKNYTIEVHGLKGTSLTIGAMELSEKAKKLEMAAREENTIILENEHGELMKMYRDLLVKLQMVLM